MNLTVYQKIVIHTLKIEGISNSSVFQIGSAGVIKPLSQFFNTGGFYAPAPPAGVVYPFPAAPGQESEPFYVPLVSPTLPHPVR